MISVIIPAYNCEKTLEKAVVSVLDQTFRDFELIIVNDGSTDGTEQVARRLGSLDQRIKVITTENRGVSQARNRGIDEAAGEYLCFIDSDDWVEPEFLEALAAQAKPDILPCVGMCHNGDGVSYMEELPGNEFPVTGNIANDLLTGPLKEGIKYSACNKMIDAAVLREHSIRFFGGYKIGEDLLFILHYIQYCKKATVDNRPLYCCYANTSSVTRNAAVNIFPEYEKLMNKLIELRNSVFTINDDALQAWAFDRLISKVSNGYPQALSAPDFKDYCRNTVFPSSLYQYAIHDKSKVNFQRRIFRFALRRKNISLLKLLIQGKNVLKRAR